MDELIWTRPARLADIPFLHEILKADSADIPRKKWTRQMRSLFELCGGNVVLAACSRQKGSLEENKGVMLAGVQIIDPVGGRALLHIISRQDNYYQQMWDAILKFCFFELDLYRLEIHLDAKEKTIFHPEPGENWGWTREALLHNAGYSVDTKTHHDVVMYSIIRPCFNTRATAFVLFSLGVFIIYGTDEEILATAFAHFGSSLHEFWQKESAEILNLLEDGKLKNQNQIPAVLQQEKYLITDDSLSMVKQAANQAHEYFHGKRKNFELKYSLCGGSEFQTKVWRTLDDIPYGATWSYEEMAEHIIDSDDRGKARNLSRAIGGACAANPISLFLPCHRVIGKDGKLTGFGGGLDIKEFLLEHEMFSY